tara:strand:- start:86 stop:739 length:654 start_codon:yes stop_codon:yes gene_type:complete
MLIQIDSREPDILKNAFENKELLNLDLGDIVIKKDNIILCIFERKTINDLLASVKDSRYTEQSERLNSLELNNNCIYYIIEGNRYNYSGSDEKTLYSCIYSLSYNKGFSILLSNNIQDTIKLVKEISLRLNENKSIKKEINLIKKPKVLKENIYSVMLSNIPGIGLSTAKEILSYFNNDITKFIIEVKNDNKCLNEIKIHNKKLNKKIIENINNYLI